MSSYIANKIKINFCFVLNQSLYCSHNTVCQLSRLDLNNNNFTSIVIILYTSFVYHNNCSIDLYNSPLQTTIILFTRNLSSHSTDWILSKSPLPSLFCLFHRRVSSLMNTLEGECLNLREIYKCTQVVYCYLCILLTLCLQCCWCMFTYLYPFFILMLSSHNTNWILSEPRVFTQNWPNSYWIAVTYISGGIYSLKSTPNDRFFLRNFSWQLYLLSEFLPEICWKEIAEKFLFVFCFCVWPGVEPCLL